MNDSAVIGIIKSIFTFYGYSVTSSDISDLVAQNDTEKLFIKYEPSTNFNNARYFAVNLKKNNGKGILISNNFDDRTKRFASNEGISLWDREELESWVGKSVLSGALSGRIGQGYPVEETTGADMFSAFQAPVPEEKLRNEPVIDKYEKTIRLSLPSVQLNIGKQDALSIAKEKLGVLKSMKLKFVPTWYYRYSFSTQKMYRSKTVDLEGKGEGCINGLTFENSCTVYSDILESTLVPTKNYEIVRPVVEKKDASAKAIDSIIRDYAKEERINEMIGDTIVFQQKVFAPDPSDITLGIELIHIPVWEIEGENKILEINGHDGHITEKKTASALTGSDNRVAGNDVRRTYDDAEFV
ncbi:MAG: hypothetical protein IBX39_08710 [Candidatus Methanoperedenaceae archaeon]|nr:hypothetical protein [Candidatus Methanoperedenaceae archaeon]